jgi:hypothetical protein
VSGRYVCILASTGVLARYWPSAWQVLHEITHWHLWATKKGVSEIMLCAPRMAPFRRPTMRVRVVGQTRVHSLPMSPLLMTVLSKGVANEDQLDIELFEIGHVCGPTCFYADSLVPKGLSYGPDFDDG